MLTINYLDLNWQTVLKRYFLMMFFVIVGVMTHMFWIAFLALPVFLSAILGIRISRQKDVVIKTKVLRMKKQKQTSKAV